MAETPVGYLPDFFSSPMPEVHEDHSTEILMSRSGAEQRRPLFLSAGYRRMLWASTPLSQAERYDLRKFLAAKRGRYVAFYGFAPFVKIAEDFACGSVSSASRMILPLKITGPIGGGGPLAATVGSLTDIRVGGQTKAFTRRSLLPRPGTYASLRFNLTGTNQSVDCGAGSSLRPAGSFSVAAWVYIIGSGSCAIASNVSAASNSGFRFSRKSVASGAALSLLSCQSGSSQELLSVSAVPTGVWTHVAAVISGASSLLYINGVVNNGGSVTAPTTATQNFTVGNSALTDACDGLLSDVRFYDAALAGGEILNIYNGNATPSANLKGWWRLTEGGGAAAADLSGNGNNGTLQNSPVWVAGEEEVTFTAGAQTGAVTAWGTFRERLTVRYDSDSIDEAFFAASPAAPLAIIRIPIKEVA